MTHGNSNIKYKLHSYKDTNSSMEEEEEEEENKKKKKKKISFQFFFKTFITIYFFYNIKNM